MNDKKMAFILCVNDEQELCECSYYLERLLVPEGYEAEVITIVDAKSMAAGYNEAMHSSDAKYKVYMHQDTFIKNRHFMEDILAVFQSDAKIGLLGVIGRKQLSENLLVAMDWDTGKILHNCANAIMDFSNAEGIAQQVEAVDGLLMATQYDVEWREDLFDGWDFYDVSQCMEFLRAGYRVVVPKQEDAWCYHDNSYSRLKKYFVYQQKFATEYIDIRPFRVPFGEGDAIEREELLESLKANLMTLIEQGKKNAVAEVFMQIGDTCYLSLRELSAISQIDRLEAANGVEDLFWKLGMGVQELLEKVRLLKHQIKRVEFVVGETKDVMEQICKQNSVFAVATIVNYYVGYKNKVAEQIANFYCKRDMQWEAEVWGQIREMFSPGIS